MCHHYRATETELLRETTEDWEPDEEDVEESERERKPAVLTADD